MIFPTVRALQHKLLLSLDKYKNVKHKQLTSVSNYISVGMKFLFSNSFGLKKDLKLFGISLIGNICKVGIFSSVLMAKLYWLYEWITKQIFALFGRLLLKSEVISLLHFFRRFTTMLETLALLFFTHGGSAEQKPACQVKCIILFCSSQSLNCWD